MKQEYASALVENLATSAGIHNAKGDLDAIRNLLEYTEIDSTSHNLHVNLPRDSLFEIYCDDVSMQAYHSLIPRRIIINSNFDYSFQNIFNRHISRCLRPFNYSTSSMLRSAQGNQDIVKCLNESTIPFSILSRLRSVYYDCDSEEVVDGPIITSIVSDRNSIDDWQSNETYSFRRRFILGKLLGVR